MEKQIIELVQKGKTDQEITDYLSTQGYRSPMKTNSLLVSTIKGIRLKHRLFVKRSQSHPRRIAGFLTVSQIAEKIRVSRHWIYDRIHNEKINLKAVKMGNYKNTLYLFPDTEETIQMLKKLKERYDQKS